MLASSAWAVQIFDVAFSRRISLRVCRPAVPAASGCRPTPDDAAGRLPDEGVARGEKRRVGPAVAERHAEALRVADDHIGARLARWRDERERQQISPDADQDPRPVCARDQAAQISDLPAIVRELHVHPIDIGPELPA
jgi:hypothetical protein